MLLASMTAEAFTTYIAKRQVVMVDFVECRECQHRRSKMVCIAALTLI